MPTKKHIQLFLAVLFALTMPLFAMASSLVVSTVKNPDPYNNNLSWFRYYQYPGSIIEDALVLRNIGDKEETIRLYATDATVNQAGSFTPKMETENQKGLGLWTVLSAREVTLAPQETREIPFVIKIPYSIAPGEYFGSIINEQSQENDCNSSLAINGENCPGNIQIKTRTGNRIYLTIPGETRHDITLKDLKWEKTAQNSILFKFNFVNKGNVAFEPKAVLNIYNNWGEKIGTVNGTLGKSLPSSSISPMLEWPCEGFFGNFSVKAEIYYLEDNQGRFDSLRGTVLTERREITLFIFPWVLAVFVITVFAAASGTIMIRRKKYMDMVNNAFRYQVKEEESIIDIARHFRVRWQDIVKINDLTAPYVFDKNQIIKIPGKKSK